MDKGFVFSVRHGSTVVGQVHHVHATRIEAIDRYMAELIEGAGPSVNVWRQTPRQIAFDHVVADVYTRDY